MISVKDETDWHMTDEQLSQLLRTRWPDVELRPPDRRRPERWFNWTIHLDGRDLDGRLEPEGQAVALDAYLEDCAVFAAWFRSLVPPDVALLFFDQGYNFHVDLEEPVDPEVLIAAAAP